MASKLTPRTRDDHTEPFSHASRAAFLSLVVARMSPPLSLSLSVACLGIKLFLYVSPDEPPTSSTCRSI